MLFDNTVYIKPVNCDYPAINKVQDTKTDRMYYVYHNYDIIVGIQQFVAEGKQVRVSVLVVPY